MKKMLSFEFWQKFGKCLMVVIAVMPAAGLMVSIGNSLPLISDAEWLVACRKHYRPNWLGDYW